MPEAFCFRVCPSVSESVRPENLVNTIRQKPMKRISPDFGHSYTQMYLGSYVLIKFWGQKVKAITIDGSPLSYIKLEMFCGFPFK